MVEHRGRPKENIEIKRKFIREYNDSTLNYDLDKFANGPYLVEIKHPELDKLEKLCYKLERLQKPKFHENGRKKRTTKTNKIKIKNTEIAYWKEHYRLFPNDIPKRRGRPPKRKNNERSRTN